MSDESKETESIEVGSEESDDEVVKEEVKLQYHWYLIIFFIIYYGSWLIPCFLILAYFISYFIPSFLSVNNFFLIFTDVNALLALCGMPLVIIGGYIIRLIMIGVVTRIFWRLTEKVSPSKSGVIPRNVQSKAADYYHIRSFMIKYGKNIFNKGMFPGLTRWFYNFVGTSKIGKGSVIEESVGSEKFIDLGDNAYIGVSSTLASHVVQGIFGNIQYFEVKIGDNVTFAAMNHVGPGSEVKDNTYLLPWASTNPHSFFGDGKKCTYYFGMPLRKIFKKKIMNYLGITEEDLDKNQNLDTYLEKLKEKKGKQEKKELSINEEKHEEDDPEQEEITLDEIPKENLTLDVTTSSSISRVNIKFLAVYIPVIWLAGLAVAVYWMEYSKGIADNWIGAAFMLPISIISMLYIFILAVLIFSKLLLILVNLIHKPKEGIFLAEIGDTDYEFWMLRKELRKFPLWLFRNSPLPWIDALAFRWFGVNMDFSSHMNDAWVDSEFLTLGRQVLVGQGATIMSSMVIGKYLIIKRVILDDYVMVGGHTTIAPGTIVNHDTVVGALSTTTYNQILEDSWIYFGIPVIKLKKNKYAEVRRDIIIHRDVDDAKKSEETHEVNIDEDKKDLIRLGDED